jgi:phosphoserine phosphatase RsbU/P
MFSRYTRLLKPIPVGILLMLIAYVSVVTDFLRVSSHSKDRVMSIMTSLAPFEAMYPNSHELFTFVDIDDASLSAIGQWPWPRKTTSELVSQIFKSGAAVVGVDILFSEVDRLSLGNLSSQLNLKENQLKSLGVEDGDARLGAVVHGHPTVLSFALTADKAGVPAFKLPNRFVTVGEVSALIPQSNNIISPIKALGGAQGYGFVNIYKEQGVIRKTSLVLKHHDILVPALGIELLRIAQGVKNHAIKTNDTYSGLTIKTGEVTSETDLNGSLLLHYGHMSRFHKVSANDVMKGKQSLTDKIVILGSSAKGLGDFHTTPLEDVVPGPLFHLQVMDQILNQRFINNNPLYEQLFFLMALLVGALLCFLIVRRSMALSLGLMLLALLALSGLTYWGFVFSHFLLNGLAAMGIVLTGFLGTYFSNSLIEAAAKREVMSKLESNELLTEVMERYADTGDIYHSLEQLTPQILAIIKADAGLFFTYHKEYQRFTCAFTQNASELKGLVVYNEIPVLHEVYQHQRPSNIGSQENATDLLQSMASTYHIEIGSVMTLPVSFGNEIFGCLQGIKKKTGKKINHFSQDDIGLFGSLANNLGIAIKNVELSNKVVLDKLLEKDLRDAELAQSMMFPDKASIEQISGGVLPYRMLSGDFIDYFKVGDRIAFIEGDVSGKGVPAAIMMSRCVSLFRIYAKMDLPADTIACRMNQELSESENDGRFVSLVLGWVDLVPMQITFVNCGHNPVISLSGSKLKTYGVTSPPIGIVGALEFKPQNQVLQLTSGDALFIATDGVTEAKIGSEELGVKGLAKLVYPHQQDNAIDQFHKFYTYLTSGKLALHDDATLLIIKV